VKPIALALAVLTILVLPAGGKAEGRTCVPAPEHWRDANTAHGLGLRRNSIRLTRTGRVLWNGRAVADDRLDALLGEGRTMTPPAGINLRVDPDVPCTALARLRQLIEARLDCRHNRGACLQELRYGG
jgi:hypothetical protein